MHKIRLYLTGKIAVVSCGPYFYITTISFK